MSNTPRQRPGAAHSTPEPHPNGRGPSNLARLENLVTQLTQMVQSLAMQTQAMMQVMGQAPAPLPWLCAPCLQANKDWEAANGPDVAKAFSDVQMDMELWAAGHPDEPYGGEYAGKQPMDVLHERGMDPPQVNRPQTLAVDPATGLVALVCPLHAPGGGGTGKRQLLVATANVNLASLRGG